MKFKLIYYNKTTGEKKIVEIIERKNLKAIKRYLKFKNVIGGAEIYSYLQKRRCYYKPQI